MSGSQQIALNTYKYATRDSELARFQMFSAYTGPTSIEHFNRSFAPEHSELLQYTNEMRDAAWSLVKQVFFQTERFAQSNSLGQVNAYPVFSLESLARMIKLAKTKTDVSAHQAQDYVWFLVCEFRQIYDGNKTQAEISKRAITSRFARHPNAHKIRTLLGPDAECSMHFMQKFPDNPQAQTDFFRFHCLRAFQEMVMDGSNFMLAAESSFANPTVACFVIDALERLCVASLLASNETATEWIVGSHFCTSSTRTHLVDKDMRLLLCSFAIPFIEDWELLEAQQKEKEAEEERKAQENEAPEVPQEEQKELSTEDQPELPQENKEPSKEDSQEDSQEDPKPTDGASQ